MLAVKILMDRTAMKWPAGQTGATHLAFEMWEAVYHSAQGLKPIGFCNLYGTTKVVP